MKLEKSYKKIANPSQISLIFRNAGWMYFGRFLASGLHLAISMLIVKTLPLEDYARYGYLFAAVSIIGIVTYLGIPNSYQRYLPEMISGEDLSEAFSLYWYGIVARVLALCSIVALVAVISSAVIDFTPFKDNFEVLFCAFPLVFGIPLIASSNAALSALLLQKESGIISILTSAGQLLFIVGLKSFQRTGLQEFIFTQGVIYLLQFIISSVIITQNLGGIRKPTGLRDYHQRVFTYSKFNYFTQLQYALMDTNIGILLAGLFLTADSLAHLNFVMTFSASVFSVVPLSGLQEVVIPVVLADSKGTAIETFYPKVKQVVELFANILAFIYFPILIGIAVFTPNLIVLLGREEYLPAAWLFVLAVAFRTFTTWSLSSKVGLILLERPKELFKATLLFIFYLPLSLMLIPLLGEYGAIIAWGIVFVLNAISRGYLLHKLVNIDFISAKTVRMLASGIVVAIILVILRESTLLGSPVWMLIAVISMTLYGLFVILFCVPDEISDMLLRILEHFRPILRRGHDDPKIV